MDVGDNVGGGSAGDGTILLHEIITRKISNALVILYDPETVGKCVAAGVCKELTTEIGAKTDRLHGAPLTITGKNTHDLRWAIYRNQNPPRRLGAQRPRGHGSHRN